MSAPSFPLDDVTLDLLWSALHPEPEAERTSLYDLLDVLSEMHHGRPEWRDEDGISVTDTVAWTPHDVIAALIAEVRHLRAVAADG